MYNISYLLTYLLCYCCNCFDVCLCCDCQLVGKLYMDVASMTWNGNAVAGKESVLKFLEELPECVHTVDGYDAQPVASMLTVDENSWLLL